MFSFELPPSDELRTTFNLTKHGPSTSAAESPPVLSASNRLYSDVIGIIFPMLVPPRRRNNADYFPLSFLYPLLSASSINRVWHSAFRSCVPLGCDLVLRDGRYLSHIVKSNFARHLISLYFEKELNLHHFESIGQLPQIRYLDFVRWEDTSPVLLPFTLIELKVTVRSFHNRSVLKATLVAAARDCPNLQTLTLKNDTDAQQTDFTPFRSMPSLTSLTIPCECLSDDLFRHLSLLSPTSISSLRISHRRSHLELLTAEGHQLTRLTSLNLKPQVLSLESLRALARLPSLTHINPLHFEGSNLDIVKIIGEMKNLRQLEFRFNEVHSDQDVQHVVESIGLLDLHSLRLTLPDLPLVCDSVVTISFSLSHLTSLSLTSEKVAFPNGWIHHAPTLTNLEIEEWWVDFEFSAICEGYTFTPHMSLVSLLGFYECLTTDPSKPKERNERIFRAICMKSAPNLTNCEIELFTYPANHVHCHEHIEDVPQPQLVGIELNPGPIPGPSTSSAVVSSSSRLYSDVIRIIFTMLTNQRCDINEKGLQMKSSLHDLLAAGSINRTWYSTLRSCAPLHCHLTACPPSLIISSNFARHINSIILMRLIHLDDLALIACLPLIRHLKIVMWDDATAIPRLPPTLTHLQVTARPSTSSHPLTITVLKAAARDCHQIQTITFTELVDPNLYDFVSVASIPSLTSLTLPCQFLTNGLICYFIRLTHLTHLDFRCEISLGHLELLVGEGDQLIHLSSSNIDRFTLTSQHIRALTRLPSLASFNVASKEMLTAIISMKKLRLRKLGIRKLGIRKLGLRFGRSEEFDLHDHVIPAISTLQLDSLELDSFSLTSDTLRTIASSQPSLTSLILKSQNIPYPKEWIDHVLALRNLEIHERGNVQFSEICQAYTFPSPHLALLSLQLYYKYNTSEPSKAERIFYAICRKSAPNLTKHDVRLYYMIDELGYDLLPPTETDPQIDELIDSVPQPPLVGIELNPGPPTQLYTDLVRMIYTFLASDDEFDDGTEMLHDLLAASRVSQLWYATLRSCAPLCIYLHIRSHLDDIHSFVNFFLASPFTRHVSHLNVRNNVEESLVQRVLLALPNLTRLTFHFENDHGFGVASGERADVVLPATLRELIVDWSLNGWNRQWDRGFGQQVDFFSTEPELLSSAARNCPRLNKFTCRHAVDPLTVDFASLDTLAPSLTSLSMPCIELTNSILAIFRSLSQLTYLNFSPIDAYRGQGIMQIKPDRLQDLTAPGHRMNQLEKIELQYQSLGTMHLLALARLPALTSLEPNDFYHVRTDLTHALAKMTNLRRLRFTIGCDEEEEEEDDHDRRGNSLVVKESHHEQQTNGLTQAISSLTQLQFLHLDYFQHIPHHPQFFNMLSSLHHLTSLLINGDHLLLPREFIHHMPELRQLTLFDNTPMSFSQLCDGFTFNVSSTTTTTAASTFSSSLSLNVSSAASTFSSSSSYFTTTTTNLIELHVFAFCTQPFHAMNDSAIFRSICFKSAPNLREYEGEIRNAPRRHIET